MDLESSSTGSWLAPQPVLDLWHLLGEALYSMAHTPGSCNLDSGNHREASLAQRPQETTGDWARQEPDGIWEPVDCVGHFSGGKPDSSRHTQTAERPCVLPGL